LIIVAEFIGIVIAISVFVAGLPDTVAITVTPVAPVVETAPADVGTVKETKVSVDALVPNLC
jgi:hypothetical protein